MARTKGSGWGAGPLNYIICPACGKKKALYKKIDIIAYLKCTFCKVWTKFNHEKKTISPAHKSN
jgi:predicted  nucleic acid-binding Zn ribbon protein